MNAFANAGLDTEVQAPVANGADHALSEADVARIAAAMVTILETRAWEAMCAANAEHERNPTPKNKGKVAAAFNRFANLVGAETV